MKKRLFSILLALCMVLCLVPTTAFAESETEEPPVCSCETACTTDNMNKECPVCGAENAIPQNCGQYIPVEDRTGENGSTERADDPNGPTELSAADQVQAMIDGLPNAEEITEDNAEEVKAQLEAIDEAKEKLSDEEFDELDMTRYAEAAAALGRWLRQCYWLMIRLPSSLPSPPAAPITLTSPARAFPAQQTAETHMERLLCRIRRCTMFPLPMREQ